MSTLRTVVLAGASGFMGQHLRARLVADGVHVRTIGRSVDADARWGQELSGVLEGADEPEAAAKVVEFLLGEEFQAGLPDSMYVYPVRQGVELPESWEQWAPPAKEPIEVDAARIQENREDWLMRWSEAAGQ